MVLPESIIRRYHVALKSRGFVILAGISGTGKTWLAEHYATIVNAEHCVAAVAPNWTSNEDLLGYFNPIANQFIYTKSSKFLIRASTEYREAKEQNRDAQPFHLILDEMNLARPEHYFAEFLSAMERRSRDPNGEASLELAPGISVQLPANLYFIGTVNMDETTYGFADKILDRAQLVELSCPREALENHIGPQPHSRTLMAIWDAVSAVAPFAFRVTDDISSYIAISVQLGIPWPVALDEQIFHKILPKIKGTSAKLDNALVQLADICNEDLPLSRARVGTMLNEYRTHGFVSFS